jgi:lipopolysaccharide export system protein LptA
MAAHLGLFDGWRGAAGGRMGGAMTSRTIFGVTAATLCALWAAGAQAQIDTKSSAPIDITAQEAEVQTAKCVAIWRGQAEALQGQNRLRADTISVFSTPKGVGANGQQTCGGTDHIIAEGNVYYVTPQQNARGDKAVYTQASDLIVMTGNVIVVQGNDVARGDKLTIHVSTKEAHMESNAQGLGAPNRVRGVFYPDKSQTQGGSSSPTPPSAKP